MTTNPMGIGARVRDTRKTRGLTAANLAELAGVAPNTVSAIENDKPVRPGNMKAVLDALGIADLQAAPASAYPDDVDLVMVFVGEFLMARPRQRAQIERELAKFLIERYASSGEVGE